jgi:arylsulfatase A-like enzyme
MTGGVGFDQFVTLERKVSSWDADGALLEQAWEWISQEREVPFLAFVRLSGAHWPYVANRWTDEFDKCEGHDHSFNQGSYGTAIQGHGMGIRLENEGDHRKLMWNVDFDDKTLHHMIAHYDSKIRANDAIIGRLIERMRESNLLERTIIVVTSDHGESFGENGYMQHGPRVDEPVMHVPLIVRLPQDHPAFNPGLVVNELVRVVDIFPTILEAVSVRAPQGLDGVSLLPAIRKAWLPAIRKARPPVLWAYGEAGSSFMGVDPERHLQGVAGKHRMIRTADWKLIFIPREDGGEYRLFNLKANPDERRNVSGEYPDKVAELRGYLESLLRSEVPRGEGRELSSEETKTLRSLGYVQ